MYTIEVVSISNQFTVDVVIETLTVTKPDWVVEVFFATGFDTAVIKSKRAGVWETETFTGSVSTTILYDGLTFANFDKNISFNQKITITRDADTDDEELEITGTIV